MKFCITLPGYWLQSISVLSKVNEAFPAREREREKKRKGEQGFIFVFYVNFETLIFLLIMNDIQNLWSQLFYLSFYLSFYYFR